MDALKDQLIDLLHDCKHPGKETLVMQIVITKDPVKYIDVVERITHKTVARLQYSQPQSPLVIHDNFHENLVSGFIEPLMTRMLQVQLSSLVNEHFDPGTSSATSSEKKSIKYGSITRERSCCICRNDFNEKDNVTIRRCEHIFHEECLFEWESSGNPNAKKCPVCRAD